MRRISIPGLAILFLAVLPTLGQTAATTAASDPQAIALAGRALAALTGGQRINDVTLTGNVTRTAGSDVETGTITLKALGTTESRIDLSTTVGTRSEVRSGTSGLGRGFWVGLDGASHAMAGHNCMTDAAWFFPAFSILSQIANTNVVATYVGEETRNGTPVQHLRFSAALPGLTGQAASLMASLTTEDVYLDSASLLPTVLMFDTHADTDALTNIAVEIDFSDYQTVSGVRTPFKIRKLLNNAGFLDVEVQSALVNSGVSDTTFNIQ